MPKFKLMQKLVDRINLVSREILTGLSVIRAFGREDTEEERFDAANKDLTKTTLFTNRVMTFMMPGMMMIMNVLTVHVCDDDRDVIPDADNDVDHAAACRCCSRAY